MNVPAKTNTSAENILESNLKLIPFFPACLSRNVNRLDEYSAKGKEEFPEGAGFR